MTLEDACRNAMVDSVDDLIGTAGLIRVYQTASYATATGTVTGALVSLTCSNPAMAVATNGTGTFNTISSATATNCGAGAIATAFGLYSGTTAGDVLLTGTVRTDTGDINFNTVDWDNSDNIQITTLSFTQPES